MPGFVIEYHRTTGEMNCSEFDSLIDATRERFRLDKLRVSDDIEVVAVSARDRDAVERSHSRYFDRAVALG